MPRKPSSPAPFRPAQIVRWRGNNQTYSVQHCWPDATCPSGWRVYVDIVGGHDAGEFESKPKGEKIC